MKRPTLVSLFAMLMLLIAVYEYWLAFQPRTGPVGAGINESAVWRHFLWGTLTAACYLLAGTLQFANNLKKRKGERTMAEHKEAAERHSLERHRPALAAVTDALTSRGIAWALGGSALLAIRGAASLQPNDLDLLVAEEDAPRAREALIELGSAAVTEPKEPFRTRYFDQYQIKGSGIDVMGGFAISHENGIYRLDWHSEDIQAEADLPGTNLRVPLSALEDWYVLYLLIPGRVDKAELLEAYLRKPGHLSPGPLERALRQPLPDEARERIARLLEQVQHH